LGIKTKLRYKLHITAAHAEEKQRILFNV
jgi:hypothetical protein